ncbi:hypothetical protein DL93DRAFT_2168193 [Clavulina sp. PMI_390]|nr:hypothetical protein DL93DRAFT_2168193 [Clavulina sp. PMI_390]
MALSSSQSLADYLAIYPYPAFFLSTHPDATASSTYGSSLVPLHPNGPCKELLAGTRHGELADSALIDALRTVDAAKTFSLWVAASSNSHSHSYSLVLDLSPPWVVSPGGEETILPVKLHLVKVRVDEHYWAITTIPLSTLPLPQTPSPSTSEPVLPKRTSPNLHLGELPSPAHFLPRLQSSTTSSSSIPATDTSNISLDPPQQLPSNSILLSEPRPIELPAGTLHVPAAPPTSISSSNETAEEPTSTTNTTSSPDRNSLIDNINNQSQSRPASVASATTRVNAPSTKSTASNAFTHRPPPFEKPSSAKDEIARMMDEYAWEKTVLGPKEGWDQSLKLLRYGPELNIFYNAAYADLSGKKHPALFGKAGADAWKEIWDQLRFSFSVFSAALLSLCVSTDRTIGPHVQGVLEGKSVARQDDLLMFERLGDNKSPEETYHCWTWIPVPNPTAGASPPIVGLLNINFETTAKVVTARRLKIIQSICNRAMLAPTIATFARNLLEVLDDAELEAPFAALYTCTATAGEEASGSGSGSSSASTSGRGNGNGRGAASMSFRMSLIGSLGVPGDQGLQHGNGPPSLSRILTKTSEGHGGSGSSSNSTMTLGSLPLPHSMFPRAFHARMAIPSATTSMDAASRSAAVLTATMTPRNETSIPKRPGPDPLIPRRDLDEQEQDPSRFPLPPSPTASFQSSDLTDDGEPTPMPTLMGTPLAFPRRPSLSSSEPVESGGSGIQSTATTTNTIDALGDSSPAHSSSASQPHPPQGEHHYSGQTQQFDWSPFIAKAMSLGTAVHVPSLPSSLMSNIGRTRGWRDPVRSAVVLPITSEGETSEAAVLILGCNPRRPFNGVYAEFVDVLRMTLSSALNAVLGREAETKRADQLAQLDAAKTAFFGNASHELRTPLTLIDGPLHEAVAMLKERDGGGEGGGTAGIVARIGGVRERLTLASRNSARLSRLIDSLMDFSKIEGGKLVGRFGPVMLAPFTADLASLFRSTIEKNGIEFKVDCDTSDTSITYVDPEMWEKIVFNLIGNAFKYTLEGKITVRVRFSPLWATFQVEDSGVGIPPEDIDRIFERFHRVSNISRSHEGTGIGLALTKELVRLHGGHITVTSEEQQKQGDHASAWNPLFGPRTDMESPDELDDRPHGSTFTINIPMGHSHIPKTHLDETPHAASTRRSYARGIVDEAAQWGRGTPTSGEAQTPSDTTSSSDELLGTFTSAEAVFFTKEDVVMIVDDNTDMRRYMKSMEASNGEEALQMMKLAKKKPDVVVTDRMMPFLDGDGLLQAMRNSPELRSIPIVMVTAAAGDEARLQGLLSGADDYIAKPFTAKQLLARTHLQLQMGKRKAQLEAKFEASTSHLRVLSELAPVGIFRADTAGRITWANPMWHELIEHETGAPIQLDDWLDYIVPNSRQEVQEAWHKLCREMSPRRLVMMTNHFDGVVNRNFISPLDGFHVLDSQALGSPSILGTLTDISERRILQQTQLSIAHEREAAARRQAEESETRRQEAEERRRAQELLIDVTSHELRQPVSAILNCASLVQENYRSLKSYLVEQAREGNFNPKANILNMMEEDLEALDAIYQCGLSQERIANDVLSLSRMQLEVLSILPVDFIMDKELQRICSPFQTELKMKAIEFDLALGESVKALHASPVRLDKSRFAQIVTNLLSNAIKFTDISPRPVREIRMQVHVSSKPPLPNTALPSSTTIEDAPRPHEEYDGPIFIFVSVKDSGPGLKAEDLALLFQRFAQGSNSHEVFGGSGLGLFVSRRLCELMGGRIEVDSQYGQGATFRFFVQGKMPKISTAEDAGHEPHDLRPQVLPIPLSRPPRSGYAAAREIRKMESEGVFAQRNYVIALTGNARSAQIQSARDAGMDDVMIKPYKIEELLHTIRSRTTSRSSRAPSPLPSPSPP